MELLAFIVLIITIYLWIKNRRKEKLRIYLIEPYVKIDNPIPLCGAPDVVWINKQETLIVADYKNRFNVYDSDIIQLSVYRLLLEKTQRNKVARYGFIHLKNGKRVKVDLLSNDEVIKLYHRYQGITGGTVRTRYTNSAGYCQYCRYAGNCR
ncbi:hypothetical protein SRRS_31520 [Sporomusa rhizae]